jgi:sugar phosphate isomerase/epimerase
MIGYCTNVHPGETLDEVVANLKQFSSAIQRSVGKPINIGLWLAKDSLTEDTVCKLQDCLEELELSVCSINGFPFGNFHSSVVGHDVYKPSWCDESRLTFTTELASLLVHLLPEDKSGSISTLPLGWGKDWDQDNEAASMLLRCVDFLDELEQRTGKLIHLDLEPEPGCRLQTAADLSMFVQKQFGDDQRVRRYICACYDTCHAAVMCEDPQESLNAYKQAGISIGKVQLSSAVDVDFESVSVDERENTLAALRTLTEPRYLHQTTIVVGGKMSFFGNLVDAPLDQPVGHWRVHFHVPIHEKMIGPLGTTQEDLIRTMNLIPYSLDTHWEVETYTWDVMPTNYQEIDLIQSISSEISWAEKQMQKFQKNDE